LITEEGNIILLNIVNNVIYLSTKHEKEKYVADQTLEGNIQMIKATIHYI